MECDLSVDKTFRKTGSIVPDSRQRVEMVRGAASHNAVEAEAVLQIFEEVSTPSEGIRWHVWPSLPRPVPRLEESELRFADGPTEPVNRDRPALQIKDALDCEKTKARRLFMTISVRI